uniref:Uncharacterized protein n=1 Tax=Anguilla anguilla TaxID=7936 RepID=A0A0E9WNW2_ANGAN
MDRSPEAFVYEVYLKHAGTMIKMAIINYISLIIYKILYYFMYSHLSSPHSKHSLRQIHLRYKHTSPQNTA